MNRKVPLSSLWKAANNWFQNEANDTFYTKENGMQCDFGDCKIRIYDVISAYLIARPFRVKPEVKSFFHTCLKNGYLQGRNVEFIKIAFPAVLEIPGEKKAQIELVKTTLGHYIEKNELFPSNLNERTVYNKGFVNGVITKCKVFLFDNEVKEPAPRSLKEIFRHDSDLDLIINLLVENRYCQKEDGNIKWSPPNTEGYHRTLPKLMSAFYFVLNNKGYLKKHIQKEMANAITTYFGFEFNQSSISKHKDNKEVLDFQNDFHFIPEKE